MAHYLPPAIMAFFQPRPPLEYKPTIEKRKMPPLHGMAQFVERFKDPVPEPVIKTTPAQARAKKIQKRAKRAAERIKLQLAKWDPKANNPALMTADAYKTLFVARVSFDVSEEDLKDEFEYYGPIVKVRIVQDKKGKSRGYGFVEFERSKDLKEAYKDADGRKIKGRRILVDVERGRTVREWKPRRLGGGLGATRAGGKDVNQKYSGREPPKTGSSTTSSNSNRGGDRDRDRGDRDRDRGDRGDRDRNRGGDRDRGGGDRDRRRDSGRLSKPDRDKRDGGSSNSSSSKRRRSRSRSRSKGRR